MPEGEGIGEMVEVDNVRASSSSSRSSSSDGDSNAEVSSSNLRAPISYPVQMVPARAESDNDSEMDVFDTPEECDMDCIQATADSRTRRCHHGCRYCRCKQMTERDYININNAQYNM